MKKMNISNLPIKPEEYGREEYDRIDWSVIDSEMSDGQRRFINGLIQYYQPQKVLELGVSCGGGTVVLLNALMEQEGELYSIDNMTQVYRLPELPVGYYAIEKYSELLNKKWHLLTGQDPACVMDSINEKFDFCVLDTYHLHPVETLNFISVLPWLNDGAIVVLHDTTVFEWRLDFTFLKMLAPRLLLSVVCAEKYVPDLPSGDMKVSNIAAFQINSDTRRYCQNLFDILYLPWETRISKSAYENIQKLISKHYTPNMSKYYEEAVKINNSMYIAKEFGIMDFEKCYKKINKDTIFYGAGSQMKKLLFGLELNGLDFKFEIWDKNASHIHKIGDHIVKLPDLHSQAQNNQIMIVTIVNEDIFQKIYKQFESLGYKVFHGLSKYFQSLSITEIVD